MKLSKFLAPALSLAIGGGLLAASPSSYAAGWRHHDRTWDAVALGAAAVGVYGAVSHQPGLAVVGALGAGYSLYRADDCYPRYHRYVYEPVRIVHRDWRPERR